MNDKTRTPAIAIVAAAGIVVFGFLMRGMVPELVRYLRIRRM